MAELYRTKDGHHPIEVNRLTPENAEAVSVWCGGVLVMEHDALRHEVTFVAINVPTALGVRRAQEGDWIIRRTTGDFYPVNPYKFEQIFEAVIDG